jgi:hypothetical protein
MECMLHSMAKFLAQSICTKSNSASHSIWWPTECSVDDQVRMFRFHFHFTSKAALQASSPRQIFLNFVSVPLSLAATRRKSACS